MRKIRVSLFVLIAAISLAPSLAFAGPFRRATYRGTTAVTRTATTVRTTVATAVSNAEVATAQGVANIMARLGQVGHWGGNPGYEGCGCGSSPQAAYAACCYANSGMATVDVGYAQASNGMWYCCRRYR